MGQCNPLLHATSAQHEIADLFRGAVNIVRPPLWVAGLAGFPLPQTTQARWSVQTIVTFRH
jgi:hypothetical protein